MRTISLNTKIFLLFSHHRDGRSVSTLFSQMQFKTNFLWNIYLEATKQKFGFLWLNVDKGTPKNLRFCSDVFSENPTFYVEEGTHKGEPLEVSWDEPV